MKKLTLAVALLALVAFGSAAFAVIGASDDVPASTLLLPYFEVDLNSTTGMTTLFSINNASADSAIAHVTFWTDESIPTLDFDIYLTGYDVQTINIRDIFNGILPVTADALADFLDNQLDDVSPQGLLSDDDDKPGTTGPCTAVNYPQGLNSQVLAHIRALHTGGASAIYNGRCGGYKFLDNIARGYVTVDSVNACNLSFPSDSNYFTNLYDRRNILWGDYFYVNDGQNFAQGETLVHLESGAPPSPSFYERYNLTAGEDFVEPLPNTFAVRYLNSSQPFTSGTDLIVWRDAEVAAHVAANNLGFPCTGTSVNVAFPGNASWFPLAQRDVVAFDEIENPQDRCIVLSDVSPPPPGGGAQTCFPLEAQRVNVKTGAGNFAGISPINPTPTFGWLFLNLDHTPTGGGYVGQAWVTAVMSAQGRFSVGFDAITLGRSGTAILMQ